MTVDLDSDVEVFLQNQVRGGVCANASKLVNDMIRSIRDQQQKSFEVTPDLEKWLLEAADQAATPLKEEDFDSIRERVRSRAK